ncbi:hypothetical protein M501DRAFT_1059372 [Patellaria atrata CBS 101060]|uniref:Rhodopsin domain-containing protein n=1 Tax=Patellaria atrata CBS 101060 TaxID=1346257 RepID=A0A9P4S764_9PEZI|nr:hypothetical protein M501DRAFT_1059372 [Patellaria atrata CBS 101060]
MSSQSTDIMGEMDKLASIKMKTFEVVAGVFFGLSVISVTGRAIIRFKSRPAVALDDYLVFFGCACLIAATGLIYRNFDNMYLTQGIWIRPELAFSAGAERMFTALKEFNTYNKIALSLLWTATFSVKLSFLAFFRRLIQSVNRIHQYYWFVVGLTIISWVFVIGEPHILCPHVGLKSMECAQNFDSKLYYSLTGLVTGLDIVTDLLLVSIPIIVLHRSQIRTAQKAAVGVFLSLSLVMVVLAIARVSKMHGHKAIDIPYEMFWQYLESAVAILMASLTAYRTFFVLYRERQRYEERVKRPSYSFNYFRRRRQDEDTEMNLPEIPRATMTGVWTFIRRNNRTNYEGSLAAQGLVSETKTQISEPDSCITKDSYMTKESSTTKDSFISTAKDSFTTKDSFITRPNDLSRPSTRKSSL